MLFTRGFLIISTKRIVSLAILPTELQLLYSHSSINHNNTLSTHNTRGSITHSTHTVTRNANPSKEKSVFERTRIKQSHVYKDVSEKAQKVEFKISIYEVLQNLQYIFGNHL